MSVGIAGLTIKRALSAIAVALGLFAWGPLAYAQGSGVKAAFEKFDLLGTLSTDCKTSPPKDGFLINRAIDADYVEIDRMTNSATRQFAAIVGKADVKGSEIALNYTINDLSYTAVLRVEQGRMRWFELAGGNGEKLVTGGHNISRGTESEWYSKCATNVVIQSSPDAGGKCIEAIPWPGGKSLQAGVQLHMWDCNDLSGQTFGFDALNGRLMIGGFCVEAGKQGDPLQLARCSDSPGQVWRSAPNANFVRLIGLNDLCADIAKASKEKGASVGTWRCHDDPNQKWSLRAALNLTIDEKSSREGDTIRDFNLPAADVKLCRQACIDEKACSAWNYRDPSGRNDKQPHCWLRRNTEFKASDNANSSGLVRPDAPK